MTFESHRPSARKTAAALALLPGAVLCGSLALSRARLLAAETPKTHSRSPYVHRITLYDEDREVISPEDEEMAKPYSPRATCSKCHDYSEISKGFHFNANDPEADHGRRGEPWILVDELTGTQLPLSYRNWKGAWKPESVGLTPWLFVQQFGRHMPGGGVGEAESGKDPKARWHITGKFEIDCMSCHAAGGSYDQTLRAQQLEEQNYKWAPTVTAGLAVVRGNTKNLPDDFDPLMPPSPDYPDRQPPKVMYDRSRFDMDDRPLFEMGKRPEAKRCYFCHTTRPIPRESEEDWQRDCDVHLASGLTCVDCHRNGLDHKTLRGCEEQAGDPKDPGHISLTCQGCHLAEEEAGALGGRFGAPEPRHSGLPTTHLERLTCTACHSGPRPGSRPQRIQTARAHGLGISSKHYRDDSSPRIVTPVFVRQEDGSIAPRNAMWPAFWGYMKDGKVVPIAPARVIAVAGKLLKESAKQMGGEAGKEAEAESRAPRPSPKTICAVLAALAKADEKAGTAVYVRGGSAYTTGKDGGLACARHPAAAAYTWPVGHDVRPAGQSLGSGGCTDCHSSDSGFFFGRVVADPAPPDGKPVVMRMYELEGIDPGSIKAWNIAILLRVPFIGAILLSGVVLGFALLQYGIELVTRPMRQRW